MQKYRVVSDIHLDLRNSELFSFILPDDADTILILAGDICEVSRKGKMREQMEALCSRFKMVIHVLGNHDYWSGSLIRSPIKQKGLMADLPNYHLLQDDYLEIGDTVIMGATLWTEMKNGCPMFSLMIRDTMNDFKYIRTGNPEAPYSRKISVNDIINSFLKSKEFFDTTLEKFKDKKRIIVSHHGMIEDCLDPKYEGEETNPAYASSLMEEDIIIKHKPDVCISGHIHRFSDFEKHGTRFICNARGYPREITGFEPNFAFEL